MDKLISSRLLVHFAGDLHQPLHGTEMTSNEFPGGDYGGNKIKLHLPSNGKAINLHSFWDDGAFVWPYIHRPLN